MKSPWKAIQRPALLNRIGIVLTAAVMLLAVSCEPEPQAPEMASEAAASASIGRIFVGTGTGQAREGIYSFRFDNETGALSFEHKTEGVRNPTFIALSPDQRYLYSVNEVGGEGSVSAFSIDEQTGVLTLINQQSTRGAGPCYVSTDRSGRWVLAANYGSGSVCAFPVREDGGLDEASGFVQHTGASIDPERQTGPHAHYINVGPQNRVFAVDLGIDKVMIYTLDDAGQLVPHDPAAVEMTPGDGPRHLDVHPNGQYLYVMNELAGSVTAFAYDADQGTMTKIHTISALPEDFEGFNKSADIHVHPSGRFLYASNRGDYNSIAIFAIDETSGRLTLVGHQHEAVVWPRNFAIDPAGTFLLVANRNDNAIAVFRIDPNTGVLIATDHRAEVPGPTCIKFSGPVAGGMG